MSEFIDLIRQAQGSDEALKRHAFDELTRRFWDMAFWQAYHILNQDAEAAQDVTQETFIVAYLRLAQLRQPAGFPAWLKRIVWTQCDRLTRGKKPRLEPIDEQYDLAHDATSPEDAAEIREIQERVQAAISALPEHQRTVTERFYLQGESQREIAEGLQIPLTTVKKRLQYARQHLRTLIADLNEAFDRAAEILQPNAPQKQPIYLYAKRQDQE